MKYIEINPLSKRRMVGNRFMKNRNYHEFFLVLVSIFLMASGVAARSVSNIDSFPYNAEKIAGCNDQWDTTFTSNGANLTTCRPTSLSGGSATAYISSPFTRCVNSTGTYRFPVGSNGFYVPVELSGVVGTGSFTVEPKTGAFSGPATGLPANRLQRWWNTAATGFTQGDLVFNYLDTEVVGIEGRYRAYRINAGTAELVPTSLNRTTNRATVSGAASFAAWTLAEGPATFETLTGRITTPQNRKADRVVVSMTDGLGNVRYALTNPFGFYRFMNVETWKTYTLRLQSKKYTFSSPERTIEFAESNGDVNFVSTDH